MPSYTLYPELNLAKTAATIRDFWNSQRIFPKTQALRTSRPPFTFYEGPPSANGAPGIHHLLSITLKDLFGRYKIRQGYYVQRKSGWDTHGLPVELQVEKELGITKEAIGQTISIQDYNAHCRQTVMRYKAQWEALNQQIGYWIDPDDAYITYDRSYIESLWYLIEQLYHKGLLYKGSTIQPYSPAAGTGLSTHELNQPGCYQKVSDITVVAQFKIQGTSQDYLLAWTTTPWTLPANSALAVAPHLPYVKVRTVNPYTHQPIHVILAEAALPRYFASGPPGGNPPMPGQVVAHYLGKDLVGLLYEPILPYVLPEAPAFRVVAADFVTTEEGTGIVHIAPTFGLDDYRLAQKENIPAITVPDEQGHRVPIVDLQGRFVAAITDWAGRYVKSAYEPPENQHLVPVDVLITDKLKQENKAFQVTTYTHNYPHCWRTDKPILYYPLDAWFIKTTACKERLIELNKTIHWKPATIGSGRFGNWLENLTDWNLSRDRFWGTPLPIWRTADQQEEKCIGSLAVLEAEIQQAVAAGYMEPMPDLDLHRPAVDAIILVSDTGKKMYRETALLDVWFDSGAMPYAQWHYPFENQADFEKHYPADLIVEGIDQTRGWFFTLHALSVLVSDQIAFRHVLVNGLLLDSKGQKMSKRLGNALDPQTILAQYGPDAVRWYLITHANPWENLKFDLQGLQEITRTFFATLQHTYHFFSLYANLDHCTATPAAGPYTPYTPIDRWILSRCHHLIQTVTAAFEAYDPTPAARAIQAFVIEDLSNWYVRLNRKRFWKNTQDVDKYRAYQILFTCLLTVAQLAAPIAPFYMEQLYQALHPEADHEEAISVHVCDFPQADPQALDPALEEHMQQVQTIVSLAHALRKKQAIKVRQPLPRLLVALPTHQRPDTLTPLICAEVNVKHVDWLQDTTEVVIKKIKPNFPVLGKRYRAHMQAISHAMAQLDQAAIHTLEQGQSIPLLLASTTVTLTAADVIITSASLPGWAVACEESCLVALDLTLTEDLLHEGQARELVNRLQNLRKQHGWEVQDKITITLTPSTPCLATAIDRYTTYICNETQAIALYVVDQITQGTQLDLGDATVRVTLEKVSPGCTTA